MLVHEPCRMATNYLNLNQRIIFTNIFNLHTNSNTRLISSFDGKTRECSEKKENKIIKFENIITLNAYIYNTYHLTYEKKLSTLCQAVNAVIMAYYMHATDH